GKLWLKTDGQWVFQGIFNGFNIRGAWDSAPNYNIGDVVSKDGTSYVASALNTNQAPPNPAFWMVLAAKGDTGAQGPQGTGYAATSTTSLTIGPGPQTFATQAGLAYSAGARVRASSNGNGANYMEGLVTAYSGGSLTINVTRTGGSGTFASWNINVAGDPGAGDLQSGNNLSDVSNKDTALANLHGVSYAVAQGLTAAQQQQARNNIGARDFISVKDFGVKGDGVDTANIKAADAAAALAGKSLSFPAGVYVVSSALTPSTNVRWIGESWTNTILRTNSATANILTIANPNV